MESGRYRQILDASGHVVGGAPEDFDLERIGRMAESYSFRNMVVEYAGIGRYRDFQGGVCCIDWMLYPDGRYFSDGDGYGGADHAEEEIHCIIDCDLHVLVPFPPMTDDEIIQHLKDAASTIKKKAMS